MATDMALQVVVSPFLGVLFDNLSSLIQKEGALAWSVDKEMKKLANTLTTIQAVLADAEEKQLTSKAVAVWLAKLKALAYDADDILDEWAMEASRLQLGSDQVTSSKQVCTSIFSCFCSQQLCFRRKMAKKVNELVQKFDDIASERSKFHLREGVAERRFEDYQNRETSSLLDDRLVVYGRDEEREYVVGLLLSSVDNQEVSVCPIVGMGGLGKTTLAQLCYNDPRVQQHFDVRVWVCVSVDFDVKRLTKEILVSVSGQACDIDQLDTLQRHLQEKLGRKRFLLVLDDVWDDNRETWRRFENSLRCGAAGSAIMVTTRLKIVAEITATCSPCSVQALSENDCWSLFKKQAFETENEGMPKNLEDIGRAIVKKCGGVPLAAKVLGALMRLKRVENDWLFVRDSSIWDLPQSGENTILPALRLSYTHLAPELKQCFAYCSIYPKDRKMRKEELVCLWMANDLIRPKKGMQLEDIGNEILDELCRRSLLEEKDYIDYGYSVVVKYTMHDLLHDLACSINVDECCHLDDSNPITNVPKDTRHLSLRLQTTPSPVFQTLQQSGTNLRTLLLSNSYDYIFPDNFHLSCFSSLRALSFDPRTNEHLKLTRIIVHLKHLRYLNLSGSEIKYLPESLCKLRNLQTLELEDCFDLIKLPKRTSDISSLRHLNIKSCDSLEEMPIELGKLISLQTLSFFIVGPDCGRGMNELEGLDCLSGELEIKGLEHVKTLEDAKKANLMRKKGLTSLKLIWSESDVEGGNPSGVIEGLQPHSNVKSLYIDGGDRGLTFPSWLDSPWLSNLVYVRIVKCKECEHLPSSLGVLPLLKLIVLGELESMKFFASGDVANEFPSLESLEIEDMPNLEEWFSGNSEEVIRFPRLKELKIKWCPKLKSLPPPSSLSLLRTLVVSGCDPMILVFLKNLPRLSILHISYFTKTTNFPEEMLQHVPSLKTLSISRCDALRSLPDLGSSSLTYLFIHDCPNLINVSYGLRSQTALQTLEISFCPKAEISAVEYHLFNSLQSIVFREIHDLTSLPDGLQHVSSTLRELTLEKWPALISLPAWMGTFTKLEDLKIDDCENLSNLPDGLQHLTNLQRLGILGCKNLQSLPDGLQHLTNLQRLGILNCHSELQGRCKKGSGEYWPMIAHIPSIHIS